MASPTALPSPQRLITDLVRSIGAIPVEDPASVAPITTATATAIATPDNPLARVPLAQRPLLATLHVLFPAVLLPALDLLDLRRIVRYTGTGTAAAAWPVYQVLGDTVHVVRLPVWHCTCAYFALQADRKMSGHDHGHDDYDDHDNHDNHDSFSTPPCRHLMACLLAEQWPPLRAYVTDMDDCGPEVLAGVAAGVA